MEANTLLIEVVDDLQCLKGIPPETANFEAYNAVYLVLLNVLYQRGDFLSIGIFRGSADLVGEDLHNLPVHSLTVVRQFNDLHFYYGNLKALCDHWNKDTLGVGYSYLRNYGISDEKPFRNARCIIRKGIIVTSEKTVK